MKTQTIKIALVGNPNSGKTTMFNYLTGNFERVGNYGGVTVNEVEAPLRKKYKEKNQSITIIDLPGTFSLDASSLDEQKTIDYLKNETVDVVLNIIDASRLERSLHLTYTLKELEIPMVVALNKTDLLKRKKIDIDVEALKKILNCQVYATVATHKKGIQDILQCALNERCVMHGGSPKKD